MLQTDQVTACIVGIGLAILTGALVVNRTEADKAGRARTAAIGGVFSPAGFNQLIQGVVGKGAQRLHACVI